MTRETKIGMLVGLAFIIVIGILLSDHFRGTMEPTAANLNRAGATVRQTVNAPGSNAVLPPVVVAPVEIDPRAAVQTPRDIDPLPSPVVAAPVAPTIPGQLPPSALQPADALANVARQNGEPVIPADAALTVAARSYVAQPGDSVSRMAAKFLGSSSHKNIQAIIAANPSLQADANKVIAGQSYEIPSATSSGTTASTLSGATASVAGQTSSPGAGWSYTVKPGDTLWGIATGQLGTANAISAIKDLNRDVLHGGSSIRPGMKLRLPSAPVAVAD